MIAEVARMKIDAFATVIVYMLALTLTLSMAGCSSLRGDLKEKQRNRTTAAEEIKLSRDAIKNLEKNIKQLKPVEQYLTATREFVIFRDGTCEYKKPLRRRHLAVPLNSCPKGSEKSYSVERCSVEHGCTYTAALTANGIVPEGYDEIVAKECAFTPDDESEIRKFLDAFERVSCPKVPLSRDKKKREKFEREWTKRLARQVVGSRMRPIPPWVSTAVGLACFGKSIENLRRYNGFESCLSNRAYECEQARLDWEYERDRIASVFLEDERKAASELSECRTQTARIEDLSIRNISDLRSQISNLEKEKRDLENGVSNLNEVVGDLELEIEEIEEKIDAANQPRSIKDLISGET